jgi:nicotinamide phosphoribosyltransferase
LKWAGYSADNVAFGMGGALLQQINRDTQKFAMKTSAACVDGKWIDVYKDPVTDTGKRSKRGRVRLVRSLISGEYVTLKEGVFIKEPTEEVLETVYLNGKLTKEYTFAEVRANSNKS